MKRYLYAAFTSLVLGVFMFGAVPVLADSLGGGGNYGLIEAFSGVASSATSSSACAADSVVYDNNGVQGCVKLTDVAPQPLTVHPQHAYAQGTQTAAPLMLAGGADEKKVTIDAFANCTAGDNVVIMVNVGGTSTSTTLTYGTEWCSGACGSNDATATSLAAAIDALAGVSSVAVAAVAYVTPDLNTAAVAFTSESDATCTTYSNGTDGNVKFASTGVFEWTGRTKLSAISDGAIQFSNAAGTDGFTFDRSGVTTRLRTLGSAAYGAIIVGSPLYIAGATADCAVTRIAANDLSTGHWRTDGMLYQDSAPTVTCAAAATTFAVTRNVNKIAGDAGGNTIATITGGRAGALHTMIFLDALVTITDDATGNANTVNLNAAFTSSANDVLQLVSDGTSWREAGSRSVN